MHAGRQRTGTGLLRPTAARVALLATAAGAALLPFIGRPATSDEGGFLLLASQWAADGGSLYGHYWVDRPPVLIGLFWLAAHLGGLPALRAMGVLAVVGSVALAGALGWWTADAPARRAPVALWTSAVTAVLSAMPLLGTFEVDGELLAVPAVLAGLVLIVVARASRPGSRTTALWAAAGACAVTAGLVKQNVVDVAVVALVLLVVDARRAGARAAVLRGAGFAAGAVVVLVGVLAWAATLGTGVRGLLDAVVTFRVEAGAVISGSASPATTHRLVRLLLALLASGAPAYAVLLVGRGDARLRGAAAVLLGWESVAVLAGGSYWLHYLVGLVPGVALAVAATSPDLRTVRRLRLLVAWSAAAAAISIGAFWLRPAPEQQDVAVARWLREHARPGDTATVLYGHPDVLEEAGLESPYPYLWSLPVRVRDAHLDRLARVLGGPHRPAWVVLDGESLRTWGVDDAHAQALLARHYREVADLSGYDVLHARHGRGPG